MIQKPLIKRILTIIINYIQTFGIFLKEITTIYLEIHPVRPYMDSTDIIGMNELQLICSII